MARTPHRSIALLIDCDSRQPQECGRVGEDFHDVGTALDDRDKIAARIGAALGDLIDLDAEVGGVLFRLPYWRSEASELRT